MLCERCKIREANIQYTEVINGVKKEHNFCAQCARELDFGPYSAIFDSDFPLGKLLSGLLGVGVGENHEEQKAHQVICPTCKTSYEEFIKNSRFGCPDCYSVFDLLISDNIKQLQGSDSHCGKRPRYHTGDSGAGNLAEEAAFAGAGKAEAAGEGASGEGTAGEGAFAGGAPRAEMDVKEKIRILDAKLHEALEREEYEIAAQCRDKIKELREESGQ